MASISTAIVARMIAGGIIRPDEKEIYSYYVQLSLQRGLSYTVIFGLALLLKVFFPTLLFTISFSSIRMFSGGYHCNSFTKCLGLSATTSLSTGFIYPLIKEYYSIYQGGGDIVNDNCHFDRIDKQLPYRLELTGV